MKIKNGKLIKINNDNFFFNLLFFIKKGLKSEKFNISINYNFIFKSCAQ